VRLSVYLLGWRTLIRHLSAYCEHRRNGFLHAHGTPKQGSRAF